MALQAAGLTMETWSGFSVPEMRHEMAAGVLADITAVMDIGIMLCARLANKFKQQRHIAGKHLAASLVGGLLLSFGVRLAYGCNIGAFLSGIASGTLHGWMWIVFALIGNWAALYRQQLFDMQVPRSQGAR